MTSRSSLILEATLRLLKPLVRLMLRHGVAYPAFAAALKRVFLEAAQDELRKEGHALTDSAVSLLSGVHRRDIRNMTRSAPAPHIAVQPPMSLATQVVARWLTQSPYQDADGQPRTLARTEPAGGFDALVASVSSDIRPRTVLDELVRLGIAEESGQGLRLLDPGFAPRQGFAEMVSLLQANVHDHLASATSNLDSGSNHLEQAVFVDQITSESAQRLHAVSAKAWRQAFKTVMQEAAARFDHDQAHAAPEERTHRARFGSYFYTQQDAQQNHKDSNDAPPA
jgi:Family of unknown function (DUF6502)